MAGKKGRSGGRRAGAGRKRGGHNRSTLALLAEIEKRNEPLPSQFLRGIMNDNECPLAARIMAAKSVIGFIERKPAPAIPDEIPLMRHWSDAQWEDYDRRQREDMRRDPHYYGREFFEAMDEPWPDPGGRLTKSTPPSDRWFAEIDSKTDQRRHRGGPKPWDPDELTRALASPFHPDELERRRIYEHPNGEDPDPAA